PADAPRTKLDAIRHHGAELRAEGRDYDHAEKLALDFARATGAAFISPYNHDDVIAGAATVALEIFEEAPDVDAIIVPIGGGGGLISGIAMAAKAITPATTVIGVEVEASCAFLTSVRAGHLVAIVPGPTLADGLGGNPDAETVTFAYIQQFVDRIVTVSEESLAAAMIGLVDREHLVAEGAGAAATAAIVGGRADVAGRCLAVIVSGANVDASKLGTLLTRGVGG